MITRFALEVEEVEIELEALVSPKVTIQPTTESDKARAWLASIDLNDMQNNDAKQAEFFKYEVCVMRGERVFYLFTKSPQQKAQGRRSFPNTQARGDKSALIDGMERFIKTMETKVTKRTAQKEAKRQARAAFVNPYKIGDFLYSSWGYEQTNREFYQVLEVRDLAIKVQEVCQNRERTGYDSGKCSPCRDEFKGDVKWITIQVSENGYHSVPSPIHGNLYTYEGKPVYFSDGY
jgi:hypothetical protein